MNDLHEIEDRLRDATRAYADGVEPAPDAWDQISRRTRAAGNRRRAIWIGGTSAVAAAAVFAGALLLADNDPPRRVNTPVATTPTTVWSPVRDRSAVVHRMTASAAELEQGLATWPDPNDTSPGWVDVKRVAFLASGQAHWYIDLAAKPPLTADLEPGMLIAYGLVLDTNGDGKADYVVGLDNDATGPGDFHVWVTNLATGKTDENNGPSYGFPIEFTHPDESGPGGPSGPPQVIFTFLGDSKPADLNPESVRFYAWTSATRDGNVIAGDYAPNDGWITTDTP